MIPFRVGGVRWGCAKLVGSEIAVHKGKASQTGGTYTHTTARPVAPVSSNDHHHTLKQTNLVANLVNYIWRATN